MGRVTDKLTQFGELLTSYNRMVDTFDTLKEVTESGANSPHQTIPLLVTVVGAQAQVLNQLIEVAKPPQWDGYGD